MCFMRPYPVSYLSEHKRNGILINDIFTVPIDTKNKSVVQTDGAFAGGGLSECDSALEIAMEGNEYSVTVGQVGETGMGFVNSIPFVI